MSSPPRAWPGWRIAAAAVAAYAAMAVIHTFPLVLHMGDRTPAFFNGAGTPYLFAEQALSLFEERPFDLVAAYSPTVMAPIDHAFLYCNTSLVSTIIYGPLYIATKNIYLLHNVFILASLISAAFTMFLLLFYWTGNPRAALVGGTVAVFTSTNLYLFADTLFFNTFPIPLVLIAFDRFSRTGSRRALAATALLLVLEFYNNSYHFAATCLIVVALSLHRFKGVYRPRNLPWIALFASASVLAILPLAIPYARAAAISDLQLDASITRLSIAPSEWLNTAPGNPLYGGLFSQRYTPAHIEFLGALFPGIAVLALGVAGVVGRGSRAAPVAFFAVLAVILVALATGWHPLSFFKRAECRAVLLDLLGRAIPPFQLFRVPYRLLTFIALAGSVVCAFGYLGLERRFAKGGGIAAIVCCASVVVAVGLENLCWPRPLFRYDDMYRPSEADRFVGEPPGASRVDGLLVLFPSWLYGDLKSVGRENLPFFFERWSSPLFAHVFHRHPMAGERLSFVPRGWKERRNKRFPERIGQQLLRAVGVETVVVRGSLLRGEQKRKLSPGALERTGLKRLASFPGGDSVWKIDFDVDRTTCLDVVPQVDLDGVSLLFAPSSACRAPRPTGQGDGAPDSWRDTSAVCAEAGGVSSHALDDAVSGGACAPGQRRIPARDADVCCAEERLFFVNPKKCALQRAIVTAQDARGVRRSKEIEFQLPLVVTDPIAAGDWRPTSAEMERPIRVVSLTSQDAFLRTRKDLDR